MIPKRFKGSGEGIFLRPDGPPDTLVQYHMVSLKISDVKRVSIEKYTPFVLMMALPRMRANRALTIPPTRMQIHTESPEWMDNNAELYAPTIMNPPVPREISPVKLIVRRLDVRRTLIITKQRMCIQ